MPVNHHNNAAKPFTDLTNRVPNSSSKSELIIRLTKFDPRVLLILVELPRYILTMDLRQLFSTNFLRLKREYIISPCL